MSDTVHFRRCHVCGCLSSVREGKVEQCQHCERVLAPFFYFDDRFTVVYGDERIRPQNLENEYVPILGLTVHWEAF